MAIGMLDDVIMGGDRDHEGDEEGPTYYHLLHTYDSTVRELRSTDLVDPGRSRSYDPQKDANALALVGLDFSPIAILRSSDDYFYVKFRPPRKFLEFLPVQEPTHFVCDQLPGLLALIKYLHNVEK